MSGKYVEHRAAQAGQLLVGYHIGILVVKDVKKALHTIARHHRMQYGIPVIGITGSRGKTTLKEWLYQLLQPDYRRCSI